MFSRMRKRRKCPSHLICFFVQCITLVDYYAPLFFLEISTVKPEDFCGKVGLCKEIVAYAHEFSENSCDVCHLAVSEAVSLLKDPDNQVLIF